MTHLGEMSASDTANLLALCARPGATISADEWPRLLETIHDWDAVLERADRHRVTPMMYALLKSAPPGLVPPSVAERLERSAMACAARNAALTREMLEIQAALAQHGVRALPFKGPSLANLCYPEPSLRACDDLDFFVHPGDAETAKSVLISMGYVPEMDLSPGGEQAMWRHGWGCSFSSPRGTHPVEIQTMVMPRFFRLRVDPDKASGTPALVRIDERDIPTFAIEILLVIVCAHGTWQLGSAWRTGLPISPSSCFCRDIATGPPSDCRKGSRPSTSSYASSACPSSWGEPCEDALHEEAIREGKPIIRQVLEATESFQLRSAASRVSAPATPRRTA
ncbi:MAG: nucleotidyltransferase family protein, partial [Lentisphaerae bacterium]|nr:nucleotidyltransferase family protein [Lentisphaerota bacterium]